MLFLPLSLQLLLFSLSLLLSCKSFVSRVCIQTKLSTYGVLTAVCMCCVVCRLLLSLLLSVADVSCWLFVGLVCLLVGWLRSLLVLGLGCWSCCLVVGVQCCKWIYSKGLVARIIWLKSWT